MQNNQINDGVTWIVSKNSDKQFHALGYEGKYPNYKRKTDFYACFVDYTVMCEESEGGQKSYKLSINVAKTSIEKKGDILLAADTPYEICKAELFRSDKSTQVIYKQLINLPQFEITDDKFGSIDTARIKELTSIIPVADWYVTSLEIPAEIIADFTDMTTHTEYSELPIQPVKKSLCVTASVAIAAVWIIVFGVVFGFYFSEGDSSVSLMAGFTSYITYLTGIVIFLISLAVSYVKQSKSAREVVRQ